VKNPEQNPMGIVEDWLLKWPIEKANENSKAIEHGHRNSGYTH
jgi:hypothetical protein